MWRAIACIACLIGEAELTLVPRRTWHRNATGFVPEGSYTYKGQVRGVVDCSRVCSKLICTKSYFYYDDTRECQCHDSVYTGAEANLQLAPNVRYYEEVIEVTDLANMTRLPCPCHDSVATDVIRSGASLFRVRAFLDTVRSYDDAQAVCEASGGFLYKATTLEKFNLAQQLMMNCSAYMSPDYFVNGKDKTGTRQYKTTDGDLIRMTAGIWGPGEPNGSGTRCLWMAAAYEYRWDDRYCYDMDTYPAHAFCEIPQSY